MDDGPSKSPLIAEIVFFGIIMLFGIPGNAVLIRLSFRRASHHRSQLLVFSLAVTHLCANVFLAINIFILLSELLWNSINFCWLIHVANYIEIAAVLLSCSVTSAIAVDRYFTMKDLRTYNSRTSLKKLAWYIKILVVVAMILAVPAAVVEPIIQSTHCPTSKLSSLWRLYYLIPGLVVIGALLLILVVSIRIYFIARKRLAVDKAHKERLSQRYPRSSVIPLPQQPISGTNAQSEINNCVSHLNEVQPNVHQIEHPTPNSSQLDAASCEIILPGEIQIEIYDNSKVIQKPSEGQGKEIGNKTLVIPRLAIIDHSSEGQGNEISDKPPETPRLAFIDHSDTHPTGVASANASQPLEMQQVESATISEKLSTPDVCLAPVLTHVTKMLLLITVTFFLTHVPSVVLLIIWDVKHISFYMVNFAVNPFLCLYNKTFRRDCKRLFRLSKRRPLNL